jgi:hypothetical protein
MCLTRVGWLDGVSIVTKAGIIRFDPINKRNREKSTHIFVTHAHGGTR